jgi:hypothetical protein
LPIEPERLAEEFGTEIEACGHHVGCNLLDDETVAGLTGSLVEVTPLQRSLGAAFIVLRQ